MPDTRWILPMLERMKNRGIPDYPIDWVGVDEDKQEIIMVKFKREAE